MGFAEDKVYDYILKNLKSFRNVRVASLADSLSCLTDADRDELHSREENRGSQATVYRLYQYLKCRRGWVPDLIDALRHNNAGHLADELQHVYDSCQVSSPGALAPAAAPGRPATSGVHPATSIHAQTPSPGPVPAPSAPVAEQLSQEQPADSPPPSQPRACSTDQHPRTPVQESLSKTLPEQESPRSAVCAGTSEGKGGEEHLLPPAEVAAAPPGAGSADVRRAGPAEQGRSWLSLPQQPVCVDQGCFGNAKHLERGAPGLGLRAALPGGQQGAALRPDPPQNQPQEDSYISADSPPRLQEADGGRGLRPPGSPPENQAVPGSEPPEGSLGQQLLDGEQKHGRIPQEDGGGRDTWMETASPAATLVPEDTSSSHNSPLNHVQEDKPPVGKMASSSPSVPAKEKVLMDSLPAAAESSEVLSGKMASWVLSDTSIQEPCSNVEDEEELSKADTLLSTPSFSLGSDPLLLSTDSSGSEEAFPRVFSRCPDPAVRADPRGEGGAGARKDSCPPPSWDSTSLATHEDHYPSIQLKEGNNMRDGADPLGNTPVLDSSKGCSAAGSWPEPRVSPGGSSRASLPYILPAVGMALLSALLVYKRLQK